MLHLNRLWLTLGIAATMSSLFAADPIAVWTNFTGLTATSPLAPTFSSTQNGLNGADWRFNLGGATVVDGALQTGTTTPAKITFAASGTPTIDVGYNAKPITVLIALKGLSTSTTKGKPFWVISNATSGGLGCALNDYTATTAKTQGCWANTLYDSSIKTLNGLAGTGTKCLAMVTGDGVGDSSAITTVTATAVATWEGMGGLKSKNYSVNAIYFGNFREGTSGGMDYTLVGVAVFNGKATDAELKAIVGSPIWQGTASGSGTWNTVAGNKAWASAFTKEAEAFVNNTPAIFNDIANVTTSTVTVGGTVTPASVLVDNGTTAYTITSSGAANAIIGSKVITKRGTGTLTLNGSDATATRISKLVQEAGTVILGGAANAKTAALREGGGDGNTQAELDIQGGTFDLNTQYTYSSDAVSGYLTQKPITLGGPTKATITNGGIALYECATNTVVYDGGTNSVNVGAEISAYFASTYAAAARVKQFNIGNGSDSVDLTLSGGIGVKKNGSDWEVLTGAFYDQVTLEKVGAGTLAINCPNRWDTLKISAGTVQLGHEKALPQTPVALTATGTGALTMDGGTLEMNGFSQTIKTLTGTGMITSTSAATLTVTDATTYGGNIGGAVSLAIAANSSLSGVITTTGTITVASGKLKRSGIQPMTINALPAGGIEFDGTSWVTLADGTYPLITLPESSEVMTKATWDAAVSITNKPVNVTVVYAAHTYSITVAAITAPELTLMMIGDSITEGESTANSYRHDLWELLTVAGYNIQTVGVRNGTHDGAVTTEKWSYHNAFYSARILPTGGAMGQRMSFDAELEVCGYPDVITVLMGANDVVDYGNSEDGRTRLFNVWSDYVSRLATLRPNSQILVSTVLPYNTSTHANHTWVNPFNEKLRTAWGSGTTKAEPFASHPNVTLVDLYTTAGLVDADFIDQVHPNVAGCAKVAAGWSTAIQAVLNKESGLNGNRIPIRAFNAEPTKLSVTFNKPFTVTEEATLTASPMTATLSGAGALPTLSMPVLSADKRSVTFTATATLPTLTALTVTLANVPAIDSAKNTIVFTALGSGAAKNVPAAFRNGFLHRKTLDIGENDRYHTTAPNYVDGTDAATAVSAVKRVAYYMELQRAGEPVQFVWASMDAFDPNEVKLGVPTKHAASATGKHQAVVNGLQVYGNRGNFANTSDTESGVKGFIEFTPYSYAPGNSSVASAPAGLGAVYDWNDTLNADGEHGCMQVMQILPGDAYAKAEVLFALNRFTASGTANNVEIGIGSFSTHLKNNGTALSATLDYTNMTSSGIESLMASAYTVRKLEIWVVPAEELTWDPAKTEGNWNKTESSWSNSKMFADGNAVKFDTLTGATAATVTVTEAVAPSGLTVASNSYTFGMTGTGAITAEIVDVASGANAIFNAPLNVSNATTVNGTLTATGGTFSGATTIAANGALTTTGASTFSTTPVVNGTLSVDSLATLPATPTGAGTFVHTAGTRSLSISSTVLHKYDVQGGTLTLNGNFGNFGAASNAPSLTVANGATLILNGADVGGWGQPNSAQIATVAGTLELTSANANETFSGKITLQGTGELKNSKTANKFMLHNSAIVEADTNAMATITGTYAIKIANGTPQLNVKEGATLTVSAPLRVETNFTINTAANATLNVMQPFYIVYSGSRTVTKNGTGTLNLLNGLSDYGALTIAAGTCNMLYSGNKGADGPLTIANGATLNVSGGLSRYNATLAVNGRLQGEGMITNNNHTGAQAKIEIGSTGSIEVAKGKTLTLLPGAGKTVTFANNATLVVRGGTLLLGTFTPPSGTITLSVPAGVIIPNGGVAILTSTADLPSSAVSKFAVPTGYVLKASTDNKTLELFNAVTIDVPADEPAAQFSDDVTKQILALVSSSTAVTEVTKVTVKTSLGTAVTTVDTVNAVLGCFEGVATATVNGTTATVAIVYDFGISALAPTVGEPTSATVTCQVQGANGAAATFADGVIVGLQTTDGTPAPIEGVNEVSRTGGTVMLTVPLANIQNKAFRAVATKPDPAP